MFCYRGFKYVRIDDCIYNIREDGTNYFTCSIVYLRVHRDESDFLKLLYKHFCSPEIINYKGDL